MPTRRAPADTRSRGGLTRCRATVAAGGVLAALLVGSTLTAGSGTTFAADAGPGARAGTFAAAASEFGVPVPVLEAVSYAQTRWEGAVRTIDPRCAQACCLCMASRLLTGSRRAADPDVKCRN